MKSTDDISTLSEIAKILKDGGASDEPTSKAMQIGFTGVFNALFRQSVACSRKVIFYTGLSVILCSAVICYCLIRQNAALEHQIADLRSEMSASQKNYEAQIQAFTVSLDKAVRSSELAAQRMDASAQRAERAALEIESQSRSLIAAVAKAEASLNRPVQVMPPSQQP
jgi:hypothetical protein